MLGHIPYLIKEIFRPTKKVYEPFNGRQLRLGKRYVRIVK